MSSSLFHQYMPSPIGDLHLTASEIGLRSVRLMKDQSHEIPSTPNHHTELAAQELNMYFEGKLTTFSTTFDFDGYTPFQQKIWQLLLEIPYGKTMSYRDLSIQYGDVKAIRAVGTANGRNPIPIIVPCHRVIGSDGSLTGYALGLDIKSILLKLENPQKYGAVQTTLLL